MKMVSFCGLVCSECPAYVARLTGDDELRARTAEEWSKMYSADIPPSEIDCVGCAVVEGRHIGHCGECGIRICGMARGVTGCGACEDYPACPTIGEFLAMVPQAREELDRMTQQH